MNARKKLPTKCPCCETPLQISELYCKECGTKVNGSYTLPALMQLSAEELEFVLDFVKQSGSLKEMSVKLSLSYPTVRNILDSIIDKIKTYERESK